MNTIGKVQNPELENQKDIETEKLIENTNQELLELEEQVIQKQVQLTKEKLESLKMEVNHSEQSTDNDATHKTFKDLVGSYPKYSTTITPELAEEIRLLY